MVFSSILFLFRFLPIFLILYFLVPKRMRNLVLFFGSLFFYAWGEPVYVILMLFSTVSDYTLGLCIEKYQNTKRKKVFLLCSIVINLGLLGFFKYSGMNLPLPIGISFYTFQTMSYTIDVYRGDVKAQQNILDFGVFVTMFPQLIAGPIVKYHDVNKELKQRYISRIDFMEGSTRFIIGLGKKVLLANGIGLLFTQITSLKALTVVSSWMGILAYAFQIYFDFSGYSDMAIGLGRILGFHFPENFNYPYIAKSITEFWRRWHMTLGSWFREYVYIPLGGNRFGLKRQLANIFIVWALTGVWHGAGLNFLLWGLWFAFFLTLEKIFLYNFIKKIPSFFGWLYAMLVVLVGWCFFSLEKNELIIQFLSAMTGNTQAGFIDRQTMYFISNYWRLFLILIIGSTPLLKILGNRWKASKREGISKLFSLLKTLCLVIIFILSVANIVDASYNPFLYFRF